LALSAIAFSSTRNVATSGAVGNQVDVNIRLHLVNSCRLVVHHSFRLQGA
jgi:hypothetical protein